MSVRICPRCSTLIESRSAIFCYNCGQELSRPDGGGNASDPAKEISPKTTRTRKPSIGVIFLLLFVSFLFSVLIISLLYFRVKGNRLPSVLLKPSGSEFVCT